MARVYNLPNEEIPNRFAGMEEGHNKESRFRVELNEGRWTAYSFQMPIAFWDDEKVYMPDTDSFFDYTASVNTKKHISAIYSRIRKDENIEILRFIPSFGEDYEAGEGARAFYQTEEGQKFLHGRWNYPETIDFRHLVKPLASGSHYSKKTWKTERGAYKCAISLVNSYSKLVNFNAMDVEEVYGLWHVRLDYDKLELT